MKNLNELRRLAGLPLLEKGGHFEPLTGDETPENDPKGTHHELKSDDAPKGDDKAPKKDGKDEGEEEPTFPEIVTAMAGKMEGKTGDELIAMVDKLYNAGVKDGIAQAKAEMEGDDGKKKEKKGDGEKKDGDVPPPPVDEEPPMDDFPPEEEPKKESTMIKNLRSMINY